MTAAGSAGPRVFGVLMTRNSADLLAVNILRHLQTGCERILVVDNDSTDSSHKVLKKLAKRHPVTWSVDRGELRQAEIVTEMSREASRLGADWIIPLDTDEFWHATRPLDTILREADERGLGALECPRLEYIQARDQLRPTTRGALRATMRVEHPIPGLEVIDEFRRGERSMFELAVAPKVLYRATDDVTVERGAHTAGGLPGPIEVTPEIAIFHLPLRSRAGLAERVEHGRRINARSDDPYVSVQNRYWTEMSDAGRLEEAWRANSFENGALDVAGRRVELLEDHRLAELIEPWAAGPLRRMRLRIERRIGRRT